MSLQILAVLPPRHMVYPGRRISLQCVEAIPEQIHRDVVHQAGETESFIPFAASRILSSPFNASPCLWVQVAAGFSEFPLVIVLSSSASAIAYSMLFGAFFGTMPMSDFSTAYHVRIAATGLA